MVPTKSGLSNTDNKQATQPLLDLPLNINGNRLNPKRRGVNTLTGINNQSELELRRQTQQLAAAGEIAHMAISTLDLDLLLSSSLELIREMFSYYHASVFLVDSESNMVVLRESTGEAGRKLKAGKHKLAVGSNSLIGMATATRQPVIVQDVTSDLTHFNNPLLPETRAEAVIPLLTGSVVVGALDVQSTITGSFNASNVTILTIIADQLAIAIQNTRLYEAAQKELAERKSAEQALQGIKDELEIIVQARTIELSLANTQLETELAERNQVEEALRESELKYRTLTEHIPGVVYVDQDRDMKTIYISPYVEQMLGYSPNEWIEKPDLCWDLIHPEDRERVAEELNRAKKTSPFALEYRYIAKNGQIVWVRDESIFIKGRNGQPDIWQGILLDVTERKQAEAAAREAGTKFRTLVEQIPAITYIASLDDQRPTFYISPQIKSILGFTQEEWMTDPDLWNKQIHPDDRERVLAVDESSHATGEPFTSEYRIFARDGHVVWLHDESRWVYDEGGKPRFNQGIEFDITERKQSELLQEAVYQIAKATNQELGLNELVATIHRSIQKVMLADNFYIALYDPKTDLISYLYAVDQYDEEFSLAKSGKSMTAYVLRSGESLLATDTVYQELLMAGDIELVGTPSPVWLGVPLKIQGEAIGVMVVQDYQNESAYGEREKQLLEYVSSQVAISIQRKQAEADARKAETKYRALVERIPAAVYVWELGDNGACRYISPQVEAMLGFSVEEWLTDPGLFFRQVHPEDRERAIAAEEHSQASGEGLQSEFRMLTRDGQVVWMRDESVTLPADEGGVRSNQGLLFDITERKEAEILQQVVYEIAQATNQELSLDELFASIHGSIQKVMLADNFYIAVYDPKTNILSFPYSVDQFENDFSPVNLGKGMTELVLRTGHSLLCTPAVHQKLMDTGEIEGVGVPSVIWLGVPLRSHGVTIGVMAVQDYHNETVYGQREQQILEYVSSQVAMSIQRKQVEERLTHDALHDTLTGLPNRTLFLDRLEHAIRKIERSAEDTFAVLFLDIDRFKLVNDSLGHAFGDQLLIEIGERLKTCLRPGDTVARLGGDEFVILLEDMINAADATHIANRIQSALSSPFYLEGHQLTTTASIGIAMSSADYGRAEDLLRDADTAMYRAKSTGKARQEIFDAGMHAVVSSLLQLEADLRQAIEKQEFQVYYQPLVSTASGEIVGTEALLRWQHPTRGLLPPAAFITVLEETGMIIPAGEWILRAACLQNKVWQASGYPHLRVAVNFSARQFHIKNLAEMVKSVLNETGMDPATLELEITESTAMKDADLTLQTLNELHAMGVGISLDDFGSGYSALGYLNKYPFKSLKADRSFIMDIPNDSNDTAITAAIIAMAHSLKLRVVAEGVETQEQLEFLQSQKCDELQGFLFSRPIPAEELNKLLQKKSLFPVRRANGNGKLPRSSLLKTKK